MITCLRFFIVFARTLSRTPGRLPAHSRRSRRLDPPGPPPKAPAPGPAPPREPVPVPGPRRIFRRAACLFGQHPIRRLEAAQLRHAVPVVRFIQGRRIGIKALCRASGTSGGQLPQGRVPPGNRTAPKRRKRHRKRDGTQKQPNGNLSFHGKRPSCKPLSFRFPQLPSAAVFVPDTAHPATAAASAFRLPSGPAGSAAARGWSLPPVRWP